MFKMDGRTLVMHRGNTGTLRITLTGYDFAADDRLLFCMRDMNGQKVKQAICEIQDCTAEVAFINTDTDSLAPGLYRWGVTVVTDPEYTTGGDIEDGSGVCTPTCDMDLKLLDTAALV